MGDLTSYCKLPQGFTLADDADLLYLNYNEQPVAVFSATGATPQGIMQAIKDYWEVI